MLLKWMNSAWRNARPRRMSFDAGMHLGLELLSEKCVQISDSRISESQAPTPQIRSHKRACAQVVIS